ncbi:hypothetical protein [Bradyrhizobium ottawaense]|uniref:hypothetical protein n=1 Tax=Bradyrhizobium ottawaense TaxID=931866 RepID=UPI0030F39CBF
MRDQRAKAELFNVSFVADDVPSVVKAINSAIDRGAETRILQESTLAHGESLSIDPIGAMRSSAPGALLYAWTDRPHPFTKGRAHAKLAAADADLAFLTCASLTGHALEKNMEAGVLLMGGHVSLSLHAHLHVLIETTKWCAGAAAAAEAIGGLKALPRLEGGQEFLDLRSPLRGVSVATDYRIQLLF